MVSPRPPYPAAIARHPIHALLAAFPIVCFTLALATDLAYWQTSNLMWQHFSEWLLLVGLVIGVLAAVLGILAHLFSRTARAYGPGWTHAIGNLVVLALAFVNNLVHAADGWTGVVPNGLILSAATVAVMLITAMLGRAVIHRRAAGGAAHA